MGGRVALSARQPDDLQTGPVDAGNYNGYSNSTVDSDYTSLGQEFDTDKQITLEQDIDKNLWTDAYGVTLFQFPDVSAWSDSISGVTYSPLVPNIYWGYFNWTSTLTVPTPSS